MDTLRGARMVPRWIAVILTLAVAMGTVAVLGTIVANSFGQLEKKFPMYEREFNKLYVYIYESYCVVFMYTVYRTRRDQESILRLVFTVVFTCAQRSSDQGSYMTWSAMQVNMNIHTVRW